jgi:transcriptional regulator NrdR family protein
MKCPLCRAATDVKETRMRDGNLVFRRRVCFNDHTFTTHETVVTQPKEKK